MSKEEWLKMALRAKDKFGAYIDLDKNFYVCPACDCIIYQHDIVNQRYLCPFCERM